MRTILVIEDESGLRETIQEFLETEGFRVLCAINGTHGVNLAQEYQPDLILCDVHMPGMDGYDVLTTLSHNPTTANIPFIFLTAKGKKADWRQGMELGADDYLTKPFTADELLGAIASRLQKQMRIHSQAQQQLTNLRSSISLSLPHELRTPISSIMSSVELLRVIAEPTGQTEILEIADAIQASTERLHRLTKNFILYAQLEIKARDPQKLVFRGGETLSPKSAIAETATQVTKRAKRTSDLQLSLQDRAIAFPEADLRKVIEELVDNACKFSSRGSLIQLCSYVQDGHFVVEVSDHGRGMKPEQIANLGAYMQFEREYYEQQGTGLGLVIAKRLVELQGGDFTIVSTPGQQTIVRLTFLAC